MNEGFVSLKRLCSYQDKEVAVGVCATKIPPAICSKRVCLIKERVLGPSSQCIAMINKYESFTCHVKEHL